MSEHAAQKRHDKPNPENRGKDAVKRGLIVITGPFIRNSQKVQQSGKWRKLRVNDMACRTRMQEIREKRVGSIGGRERGWRVTGRC